MIGVCWRRADRISAKARGDFVVDFDCNELAGEEGDWFGGFEGELENIVSERGVRFDDCLIHLRPINISISTANFRFLLQSIHISSLYSR